MNAPVWAWTNVMNGRSVQGHICIAWRKPILVSGPAFIEACPQILLGGQPLQRIRNGGEVERAVCGRQIVAEDRRMKIPAIFHLREFVEAGGLMSYGPTYTEAFRRTAALVNKIFRGAKPGDLPIERPIKFELVINLETARTLGLTIPPSLLARADQVIDP